ncbi:MAG: hypothetical protein QXI10_01365 [Candidatus Diapherotrites archaeon]
MDATTTFLLIFVFSMLLGNLLLYFIDKSKIKKEQTNFDKNDNNLENIVSPEVSNFSGKLSVYESKLNLAHKRIQELENEIKQLKTKIVKLEDFKVTGSTEIIGLKEAIEDLKSFSNGKLKKIQQQNKTKNSDKELSKNEMHKLIYRSI